MKQSGEQMPGGGDLDVSGLPALFASFPEVTLVYLFGSWARGEADPGSD